MTVEQRYFQEGAELSKEAVNATLLRLYNAVNAIEVSQLSNLPVRCFSGVVTDRGGDLGDSTPPDDYTLGKSGSINGSDITSLWSKANRLVEKQQKFATRKYSHVFNAPGNVASTAFSTEQYLNVNLNGLAGFAAPAGFSWKDAAIMWQIAPDYDSLIDSLFSLEVYDGAGASCLWRISSDSPIGASFAKFLPSAYDNLTADVVSGTNLVPGETTWPCVLSAYCPFVFRFRPRTTDTIGGFLNMYLNVFISHNAPVGGVQETFLYHNPAAPPASTFHFDVNDINLRLDVTAFFMKEG